MKVIFLDVDGVLNDVSTHACEPRGCIGIDSKKVKLLRTIVEKIGALIVLTSTWKDGWQHEDSECDLSAHYLNQKLRAEGLRIIDKTAYTNERGRGIAEWIDCHPSINGWAVLDDEVFDDYETYNIMPHLIQTSYYDGGLKEEHVERAIRILTLVGSTLLESLPE